MIQHVADIRSNTDFFTVLGYAPFPMGLSPIRLGLVFTGWGILVAIFAVFGAPRLQASLGIARAMYLNLAAFAVVVLGIAILPTARGLLAQAERVQAERVAGPAPAVSALVPTGGQRELASLRLAGLLAAAAADRRPQVLGQVLQRG